MVCCVCDMRPANPLREDGHCDECGWWLDYWNALGPDEKAEEWASPVPFVHRGPRSIRG